MRSALSEQLTSIMSIEPGADALEFRRKWQTWGALQTIADRVDYELERNGILKGFRVGILLRNHGDIVPILLAAFIGGRCAASLNAAAPNGKLAEDIIKAGTPVLAGLEEDWQRPELLDAARSVGAAVLSVEHGEVRLIAPPDPALWSNPSAPGIAIEMLSSGTTGAPKRIALPLVNLEKALAGAAGYEKGREPGAAPRLRSGVQIVVAPLAHVAGITGLMNNLLAGRKVCLLEKFTVEEFRDALVRHRPKVAGAPPSALRMLLEADIPKEDFSSLAAFRTGTAPLDPDLADAFHERYGIPVLQNYGATEFAGGVAGWTLDDFRIHWHGKRGAVGRLNPGVEAHAVDPESGETLPLGEEGLLELRAPNVGNGRDWVRTTDLAILDDDRFLWIRGRHDGAIVRGGFKVLPDDVVKGIEGHPAVREASVTGIKDDRLGEVPVAAWIARRGAAAPSEGELKAWLKERLMPYQVPVRLLQVEEMPRTPSMKVDLTALRTLFEPAADAS
jgi:long-chain acyl-CoA synthetase